MAGRKIMLVAEELVAEELADSRIPIVFSLLLTLAHPSWSQIAQI